MSILFNSELLTTGVQGREYAGPSRKKSRKRQVEKEMGLHARNVNKYQDLVLHGFRCQLFIDESARQEIEEGKLLIPWMGDKSLLIDRYDCRGSLYNREEFDCSGRKLSQPMSAEEQQCEEECDKERYRALEENDVDLLFLEEEEEKRRNESYSPDYDYQQVGFSYEDSKDGKSASLLQEYYDFHRGDNSRHLVDSENKNRGVHSYRGDEQYDPEMAAEEIDVEGQAMYSEESQECDTAEDVPSISYQEFEPSAVPIFEPPPELNVPTGMEVPDTGKHHAIIEKTALFLSKQSAQMEIVLKAKQSGNPQFSFLEYGNWLNPYYKHVLSAIKLGDYVPVTTNSVASGKAVKEESKEQSKEESSASEDSSDEYDLHPSLKPAARSVRTEVEPTKSYTTVVQRPSVIAAKSHSIATPEDVMKAYMGTKYSLHTEREEPEDFGEKSGSDDKAGGKIISHVSQAAPDVSQRRGGIDYSIYGFHGDGSNWQHWIESAAKAYGCDPMQYQTYLASLGYLPPPPPPMEEPQQKKRTEPPPPPPPPGVDQDDSIDGEEYEVKSDTDNRPGANCIAPDDDLSKPSTASQPSPASQPSTASQPQQVLTDSTSNEATVNHPEKAIIPPPPDLKLVVDKLAIYVAKNGEEFEQGIKSKKDPRFEFLQSDHVYNPYYQFRKAQCKKEQEQLRKKEVAEAGAKASKPVVFMLKKKTQEKPKAKATVTAIFTVGEEEEDTETGDREGYKPNIPPADTKPVELDAGFSKLKDLTQDVVTNPSTIVSKQELKSKDDEAKLAREKQMQLERRRRAAAFIGRLKQQQQQLEMASAERATAESSSKSDDSDTPDRIDDRRRPRHFREKRYMPDDDDSDPKKQKLTEEMLEKFNAIRDKIISK